MQRRALRDMAGLFTDDSEYLCVCWAGDLCLGHFWKDGRDPIFPLSMSWPSEYPLLFPTPYLSLLSRDLLCKEDPAFTPQKDRWKRRTWSRVGSGKDKLPSVCSVKLSGSSEHRACGGLGPGWGRSRLLASLLKLGLGQEPPLEGSTL